MKTLTIDAKWSVTYDPENNDRAKGVLRHGEPAGDWDYNNFVTAMFRALLEADENISVKADWINATINDLAGMDDPDYNSPDVIAVAQAIEGPFEEGGLGWEKLFLLRQHKWDRLSATEKSIKLWQARSVLRTQQQRAAACCVPVTGLRDVAS